jgi:hypothetical protein
LRLTKPSLMTRLVEEIELEDIAILKLFLPKDGRLKLSQLVEAAKFSGETSPRIADSCVVAALNRMVQLHILHHTRSIGYNRADMEFHYKSIDNDRGSFDIAGLYVVTPQGKSLLEYLESR